MVREALSKKEHKEEFGAENSDSPNHSDEDEALFDIRMRQQILKRRQDLGDLPTKKDSRSGEQKDFLVFDSTFYYASMEHTANTNDAVTQWWQYSFLSFTADLTFQCS